MAPKKEEAQAAVRSVPPDYPDEPAQDPQSNLPVIEVDASDMPDAEPLHKIAAASEGVFDPNAALRNKRGVGPGLQDSEAKNPAVWVDLDSKEAREEAAKAEVQAAERALERAKKRANAIKKGEPLDQEAGLPL